MFEQLSKKVEAARDGLVVVSELKHRNPGSNDWFAVDALADRLRQQGQETEKIERRAGLALRVLERKQYEF